MAMVHVDKNARSECSIVEVQQWSFNMSDSVFATLIEDCVQERASLTGLIEALENRMLAPGMPIVIPKAMDAKVAATLAAFQQTIVQLDILIDAYEADPDAQ
jgi:hypothetical protein